MKKRTIFYFLGILFCLAVALYSPPKISWNKKLHTSIQKEQKEAMFLYGDPRSRTVTAFVKKLDKYWVDRKVACPVVLASSSEKEFAIPLERISVLRAYNTDAPKNTYTFLSPKGDIIENDSMLYDIGPLIAFLDEYYGSEKRFLIQDHVKIGDDYNNTPFSSMNSISEGKRVFIYYNDICNTCQSGHAFKRISELQNIDKSIQYTYMVVQHYSSKKIADFMSEYSLTVPIEVATMAFREYWKDLSSQYSYLPLNGLVLVVNASSTVEYVGFLGDLDRLQQHILGINTKEDTQ